MGATGAADDGQKLSELDNTPGDDDFAEMTEEEWAAQKLRPTVQAGDEPEAEGV